MNLFEIFSVVAVVLLAAVDVAALFIGLSIRRQVTTIVEGTGARIEAAVREGIDSALRQFGALAAQLIGTSRPDVAEKVKELVEAHAPPVP
jgi:hypothetical protein